MIYKLLNKIFGWDYAYFTYVGNDEIHRIRHCNDGFYIYCYNQVFRLDNKEVQKRLFWITCSKYKYIGVENANADDVIEDMAHG